MTCTAREFETRGEVASPMILLLILLCLLAPAWADPAPLLGADVDMGMVLPGAPHYLVTDQGDLFDLARRAGLNCLRLTEGETWGPNARPAYSEAEWHLVAERARASGITLIPVLELPEAVRLSVRTQPGTEARHAALTAALQSMADTVLSGLGTVDVIDLASQPDPDMAESLAAVAKHLHDTHPGLQITVGGWCDQPPDTWAPVGADPAAGAPFAAAEDVVGIYLYDWPGHTLSQDRANPLSQAVQDYLQTVSTWSGHRPLLISAFGSPNGAAVRRGQHADPEKQADYVWAFMRGVQRARQAGLPVLGAVAWSLVPRGGPRRGRDDDNIDCLLVPQGQGRKLRVMPALAELVGGLGGHAAGAQALAAEPPTQLSP